MVNQIVCPNCKKTISDNAMIDDAVDGQGSTLRAIQCECGEKISYWQVSALLREQKTTGYRFKNWVQSLTSRK